MPIVFCLNCGNAIHLEFILLLWHWGSRYCEKERMLKINITSLHLHSSWLIFSIRRTAYFSFITIESAVWSGFTIHTIVLNLSTNIYHSSELVHIYAHFEWILVRYGTIPTYAGLKYPRCIDTYLLWNWGSIPITIVQMSVCVCVWNS
jgi:hypothetical protein